MLIRYIPLITQRKPQGNCRPIRHCGAGRNSGHYNTGAMSKEKRRLRIPAGAGMTSLSRLYSPTSWWQAA